MCQLTKQIQSNKTSLASKMREAGMNPRRIAKEMSFAMQLVEQNTALQKCDPRSAMAAIVNIANTGLTLNPALGHAYLIPRRGQVSLMPSYQGLLHLLYEGSDYTNVTAQLVYENDFFEMEPTNFQKPVTHRPYFKGDRGDFIGAYAIALHKDGFTQSEWMTAADIYKTRDSSESYKYWKRSKKGSCIWVDWFGEMTRKTVIKRLFKYLSKSKGDNLSNAVELDNQEYKADLNQVTYIDQLLNGANIPEQEVNQISREMHDYSHAQASECITYLKANQVNPLADGRYNMGTAAELVSSAVEDETK